MADLLLLDDARVLGGGQRFALRLAEALPSERPGWGLVFACPPGSALAEEARSHGAEVVPLPFPDPRAVARWPGAIARLHALLRTASPDTVVVSNAARASAVAILAGAGCSLPLVHLMHERESAGRPSVRRVLPRRGAVLAVGSSTAAAYRAALGERASVEQVNNFLLERELRRFAELREGWEAGAPPALGVLARLIPEKGIAELVDELSGSPRAWSRLFVAGAPQDADYVRAVERTVVERGLEGRVELLGHVADVTDVLRRVDVVAVPSTGGEAQPTAILEALAAGRGVLVRHHVWSRDFDHLPVRSYGSAEDLGRALEARDEPAALDLLAARFGPAQALDAIERAAVPPHT